MPISTFLDGFSVRKWSFLCMWFYLTAVWQLHNSVDSLIQDNPEVAMDSIVHITQHMTPSQRSEVSRILANMDTWCRKSNSHNSVFTYLWTNCVVITINIFLSKTVYIRLNPLLCTISFIHHMPCLFRHHLSILCMHQSDSIHGNCVCIMYYVFVFWFLHYMVECLNKCSWSEWHFVRSFTLLIF